MYSKMVTTFITISGQGLHYRQLIKTKYLKPVSLVSGLFWFLTPSQSLYWPLFLRWMFFTRRSKDLSRQPFFQFHKFTFIHNSISSISITHAHPDPRSLNLYVFYRYFPISTHLLHTLPGVFHMSHMITRGTCTDIHMLSCLYRVP